jgi:hypothetical protein
MGVLNNGNILPVDPHVGNREPYEKYTGVFKVCPEPGRRKARPVLF